ncbi:MAG: putative NAD-dependent epimerase/dehydratase family protein, partial [Thalassolituus oleivorans]
GEARSIRARVVGVHGTDCAVGKRTTARFLWEAATRAGIRAEMIYTGQTGWMQGYRHGFIFDSTLNDFVSGELERVILECNAAESPDLILVEGQGSLRNPSGPCGSEIILSGNARGIILQHAPGRSCFVDHEEVELRVPTPEEEIALIQMYGAEVLAVTLNGEGMTAGELKDYHNSLASRLPIPVVSPLEEGVDSLIPVLRNYLSH